jgi:protein-tyrosine phosphatase
MRAVMFRRFDSKWASVVLALLLGLVFVLGTGGCEGDDADTGGQDGGGEWDAADGTDSEVVSGSDGGNEQPSRWIDLDGVVNARDVGGYPVAGGQTLRWRRILRGGTLSTLTATGCGQLASLGVATVIDLRTSFTYSDDPPPACVTDLATVESIPMPKYPQASVDNYLLLMDQTDAEVVRLFEVVGGPDPSPLFVHCVIGRDRASYAIALLMLALGSDRSTVLAEFGLSNDVGITVVDANLEAILDVIDAAGGIDAHLTGLGVTQTQLVNFRAWALE